MWQEVAAVLVLYLPRRGLLEIWSPEQKVKVTEFHVSKYGTLIRSAGVCLDDGLPQRRDQVRVFTSFLGPKGEISHFFIPFHALSITSTKEKDINAQNTIQQIINDKPDRFIDEIFKQLSDMKNIQIKSMTIVKLVAGDEEQLCPRDSLALVNKLLDAIATTGKTQSLEQKLFQNKLAKLRQLLVLYIFADHDSGKLGQKDEQEPETSIEENLSNALSVSEEDVSKIMEWRELAGQTAEEEARPITCADFIQCFDIEGELGGGEKKQVRLKRDVSPRLVRELSRLFCLACQKDGAESAILESGVLPAEILDTLLTSFLRCPSLTLPALTDLNQSFRILLNMREGSDDRTLSQLQGYLINQ